MDDGVSSYHRFLQGDTNALEALVRAYSDSVVRYAYCYVRDSAAAEDVMEDVFATLIIKRKRLAENSDFASYIFRIAHNKCVDYLRRRAACSVRLDDMENVLTSESAETDALKSAQNRRVYAALQGLQTDYRDVLYLSYFQGLSAGEIAKALGKSKKQVYNLTERSKSALKKILLEEGISNEDL